MGQAIDYPAKAGFLRGPYRVSFAPVRRPIRAVSIVCSSRLTVSQEAALSPEPRYDKDTDTYRHIYRGHPSASAVTNTLGITVFFDPDTHELLGFQVADFSKYYEAHKTPDGEFELTLPTRVPANLEEEMDFDAESLKSGIRIAEFY